MGCDVINDGRDGSFAVLGANSAHWLDQQLMASALAPNGEIVPMLPRLIVALANHQVKSQSMKSPGSFFGSFGSGPGFDLTKPVDCFGLDALKSA